MEQTISLAKQKNIKFFYGLNPHVNSDSDWKYIEQKILAKLQQLKEIGGFNFCILFDDIPAAYDVVDNAVKENNLYTQLVQCVNSVYKQIRPDIEDLWLCSPDYNFKKPSAVSKALKNIDKRIAIIWTGNNIFTKNISLNDIQRVERILFPSVRLIFWSNYPVNDCEQAVGEFNLGAFYPIDYRLLKRFDGLLVCPMREVYANFPFYSTFSSYCKNPRYYNRKKAWLAALKILKVSNICARVINQFSSTNFIDNKSDLQEKITPLQNIPLKNSLFLRSIKSVFLDAVTFSQIVNTVNNKKKVSYKLFECWDRFPTKLYISRFFPEVLRIVEVRYLTWGEAKTVKSDVLKYFKAKYTGGKKLNICENDELLFLKSIKQVVETERKEFLKYINSDTSINAEEKIRLMLKRKSINRFTC